MGDAVSQVSVVIPVRKGGSPEITLRSLARQTFQDFEVIVSWDRENNANWARNRGAELATSALILFSDDDIAWEPDGLAVLVDTLERHPGASYAFGSYDMEGWVQCHQPFCAKRLQRGNYISTMSLVRRGHFVGFDEALRRAQDWDLWLSMLKLGRHGVQCGHLIFRTTKCDGISYGHDGPTWKEAAAVVREKHGLT